MVSRLTEQTHPQRRAADRERLQLEEATIEELARELCPRHLAEQYSHLGFTHQRYGKKLTVFPIWRRYCDEARKVMQMHQLLPATEHLPLGVTRWLALLLLE